MTVSFQERTGVQMIMIQDDPMPTGADKPLRITGDPHKVQVGHRGPVCAADFSVYTQFYMLKGPGVCEQNFSIAIC